MRLPLAVGLLAMYFVAPLVAFTPTCLTPSRFAISSSSSHGLRRSAPLLRSKVWFAEHKFSILPCESCWFSTFRRKLCSWQMELWSKHTGFFRTFWEKTQAVSFVSNSCGGSWRSSYSAGRGDFWPGFSSSHAAIEASSLSHTSHRVCSTGCCWRYCNHRIRGYRRHGCRRHFKCRWTGRDIPSANGKFHHVRPSLAHLLDLLWNPVRLDILCAVCSESLTRKGVIERLDKAASNGSLLDKMPEEIEAELREQEKKLPW